MTVGTGYRRGARYGTTEEGPSSDFGRAIEEVLAAGPEPDAGELEDGRRLVRGAPTADLSGMDPRDLADAVAAAMGAKTSERSPDVGRLPCGCRPGVGVCLGRRDLAERIRRAKRRAAVRLDRGPLREAEAELARHHAEQRGVAGSARAVR